MRKGFLPLPRWAGAPLLVLALLPSLQPVAAAEQAETPAEARQSFLAGYYSGCIEEQAARGKSKPYQDAYCACSQSIVGELPPDELRPYLEHGSEGAAAKPDLAFLDKLLHLGLGDCVLVGQFDDTKALSKEELWRLGEPKNLPGFSIRLPRGFLVVPAGAEMPGLFAFARLHADLQTSTVIQVAILDVGKTPPMAPTARDRQQVLEMNLKSLRAKREGWTQSEPTEVTIGGLHFATVDWKGTAEGKAMEGVLYATLAGSRIVWLSAQDFQPFAADTLPHAKEVLQSVSLSK